MLCRHPCSSVCYLRQSKIFQVYWLVTCVIMSVYLTNCLIYFWDLKVKKSTQASFLKSLNFLRLTRNLNRICVFGHWIQAPIIFQVKFVLWIPQVSCYAWLLSCLFVFLWAGRVKKLWTYLDETRWTGWVCDEDRLIRFSWRSGFRSDNFCEWFFTIKR